MLRLTRFVQSKVNIFNKKTCFSVQHTLAKSQHWNYLKLQPEKNYQVRNLTQNKNSQKLVGQWLFGCSGMVFVAVILGGVTRLTESGLSMVTWKILGEKMPTNKLEWENEFLLYQQFPEFKMKNTTMTLEDFKFIYTMEYLHRMWGRVIGAVFLVPATVFWKLGYFCRKTKKSILLMGALLGAQGLLGWYMVKSGLEDRFQDVNDVPRVSQYRLASHLAAAFALYAVFLTSAFSKVLPAQKFTISVMGASRLRNIAIIIKGLIFTTAISGAFVAGLDAGLVYNSFPKMADNWIPDDLFAFKPVFKNFTENPTTVQFDHRILGISTVFLVFHLWILSRRMKLPKRAYWAINAITTMVFVQAALGITTLLNHVPIPLAAAHQSGSLLLLSFAVWLSHELRFVKYILK